MRAWLISLLVCFSSTVGAANGLWGLQDDFVDEQGAHWTLAHWASPQTVVSMEYSACRFVCTTNWRRLVDIQAEADRQKIPVRFLVISLDPAHDSPAAWRDYRKDRGLERSNWSFVTGGRAATDKVVAALNVKWWTFNDNIMHDFRVLRLNAAGETIAVMHTYDEPASAFLAQTK